MFQRFIIQAGGESVTVVLHGYWRSGPSWRVRIALAWKGIAYRTAPVNLLRDEQRGAEYLRLNPQGRLPMLEIEGLRLVQSPAILEHLEATYPYPPLLPDDAAARARARAMAALIACDVAPLQNMGVQRRLRAQFHADDAAVAAWNRSFIDHGMGELERQAAELGGAYLAGYAFSLADAHLLPQMASSRRFGASVGSWKRLQEIEAHGLKLSAVFDTRPEVQPDAPAA